MPSAIHYRLLGQGAAFTMHAINSLIMFLAMQNEELMKDPQIKDMTSLQAHYLTVWNIVFQMTYFSLAFACDLTTVTGREHLIPKSVRQFRQSFFTTIVFTITTLIFVVFWPLFIYDRGLLFPAFIDKIFSFNSNLVMHFFILPAVLWEVAFLQRPIPKSHAKNIGILVVFFIVYVSVIILTFYQRGLFPYPIMMMTYGTVYFPLFLAVVFFLAMPIYQLQWKLTAFFWGPEKKKIDAKSNN